MTRGWSWIGLLFAALQLRAAEAPALYNFDRDAGGKPPPRLTVETAGSSAAWSVQKDSHAPSPSNVLAEKNSSTGTATASIILADAAPLQDGTIQVRFKVEGKSAQSIGLVYRFQSPDDYYVVVVDCKEDTVSLERTMKGKRKQVDSKLTIVTADIWHEVQLKFRERHYTVFIDDELALGGKDNGLALPGKAGLWAQADAARFDDLRIGP